MNIKTACFILSLAAACFSEMEVAGISPSVRIGYEFGECKGFVAGIGCGIFYFSTSPPGPVASVNTVTQFSFRTRTFSQSFDLSLGVVYFLIGSIGCEFGKFRSGAAAVTPFYQVSLCPFDLAGFTFRKYMGHDEQEFLLRAGFPVAFYSHGSFLNLNLKFD